MDTWLVTCLVCIILFRSCVCTSALLALHGDNLCVVLDLELGVFRIVVQISDDGGINTN